MFFCCSSELRRRGNPSRRTTIKTNCPAGKFQVINASRRRCVRGGGKASTEIDAQEEAVAWGFENAQHRSMVPGRNPVGWFEIYVDDMPRAKAFYERTFEIELQPLNSPVVAMLAFPMADIPGCTGALVHMAGGRPAGNAVIVYFSCIDCAVEAGRAAQNGGAIFKEKFSIGEYGFIALVRDTEGNLIGLHSRK
jgi:predicted enzyme related to lactoylglutathione lyase